ncbi:MAG: GPR endopeptidase [Acidaminococcus sp.]|nr:GPR endopeptidase [Acidaminococcus sp.]
MNTNFYNEIAIDTLENSANAYTQKRNMEFIEKTVTNIKTEQTAKELDKPKGVYVTFDVKKSFLTESDKKFLVKAIGNAIKEMSLYSGGVKKNILVVGLGNGGLVADCFGPKVSERVTVTRSKIQNGYGGRYLKSLAAIAPNVYGVTGVESFDVVKGIVGQIKPDMVIAIDTLCTSKVSRIGKSFQLSTAGIEPASGVGGGRTGLSFSTLKVPTLAIGVPLVAKLDKVIFRAVSSYDEKRGETFNAAKYAETLVENNLPSLIIAPKEIDFLVDSTADIVASAINFAAFGESAIA